MIKPRNYENTKAQGDFTPVELGGHKLVIKQVSEKKSKNNKDMIVVLFDFAQDDIQPGYFSKQFADDIRPEARRCVARFRRNRPCRDWPATRARFPRAHRSPDHT